MKGKQRFDEFIIKYLDNAHKLAQIYIKNPDDVEDVVSESIVKALRNADAIKDSDFLIERWFNRILINTAIDLLRRQSKRDAINMKEQFWHIDDVSNLYIEGLLEVLPERDRQIVSMRFCENHTIKEIAAELGMNENTVGTRIFRSLKKLKLEIVDEGINVKVRKDRNLAMSLTVTVIAVLLTATLVFNLSPTLAAAAYDIPVLGDIVRVITFNRFEYKDKNYSAEILVPEIQGLLDPELQDRLNAEFREYADELILSFEASILQLEELGVDELDGVPTNMSVKADYSVRTDNDRVLSIDAYLYSEVNNYEQHKLCTIDKKTGTLVTLPGLFEPDADYITPISAYILTEMKRLNTDEDGQFDVGDVKMSRKAHTQSL